MDERECAMIKYKTDPNESGVQLLSNRFACYLKKDDYRFIRKRHGYYRTVLELGLIISLLASTILFQAWKRMVRETKIAEKQLTEFIVEEIPVTEINQPASVPSRPTVPIASEDEDLPEDETIELTNLDLGDIPVPPPPPVIDDDVPIFVAFDEPPAPVGGYAAIMRNLVYPEIGRRSGVEGKVILELKSVEQMTKAHRKQIQTYLRLTGLKLGYLFNFGAALMKDGIVRAENGLDEGER